MEKVDYFLLFVFMLKNLIVYLIRNIDSLRWRDCCSDRLDDPLMWGFKGFPVTDAKLARWVLAAEDICFKNTVMSYFFRLGI